MKLTDFEVLSFDCYGTLIDWETGIFNALKPLAARSGKNLTRDQILEVFGRHESPQQKTTPTALYSDILRKVYDRIAKEWKLDSDEKEREAFGTSVKDWPPFPDSLNALHYFKQYYKLAILSNIDRGEFEFSKVKLGVEFDCVVTAQDVGSYKPDPKNFAYLMDALYTLGFEKKSILHVAESLYHDHVPANAAGLASSWIHRRHDKEGFGAIHVPATEATYNFRFISLAKMVESHQKLVGEHARNAKA
ncbi:haloacid dehalogenase type II [Pseudomonas reactans]|uniref:Haloacid dehalogenase type II n=1 Tax=Pseudomonas reactans TaxID=117680 RepID=A0ABX2QXU2_9PSED|nr:haloacid dehalogenase type II [Pseudomonas reactans]NWA41134.1 haloacid dehalogenase type II [Pseudomonas reactans]NWC89707.1 haloacid dehalogenase type II [Pseudomonas reactans]NWD31954.1 haloacid dehalogenase type II [Pseudomonas reactans]NWD96512.1 haloacid dehalogenase type II [Pseudomonas reactans]NWF14670.1 haloacid dehalogenase type II [Pseudomonas reactans]